MSYLLEMLGRGLLANLWGAFPGSLELRETASWKELKAQAAEAPDDPAAAVRFGTALLREGRAAAARRVFTRTVEAHPDHGPAILGLACALDELGRLGGAIELLRRAQRGDPASPAILFCLGYCYERESQTDTAAQCYRDALTLCPGLRNAHERLAAIHLRARNIPGAIEHYRKLCDGEPHQTDLHLTLANLLLQDGQYAAAIDRYQHALSLEPDNWAANDEVVTAYEKAGMYREAIEHMHATIEREPGFADSHVRLGDLYAQVGNDVAAMEHYLRAIELHPEYLEATVKIGTQHLRAGRYTDAARWFTQALEINDRLLIAYVGLGVAQVTGGRTREGRATFDMALAIEPNSTLLFSEMARMQLKAAVSRQADKYLAFDDGETTPASDESAGDTALEYSADDTPVHKESRAGAEGPQDLLEQQVERHRAALKLRPQQADLHYRLGLLYRHQGDLDNSIASFENALRINPSYVKALIKLGMALLEHGDEDGGIQLLRRAVALEPEYVDLHYQLGLAFAKRQQFDIAVEHFEHAVAGNPKHPGFQANLALALQHLGLIDRASACWESVKALAPGSEWARDAERFGGRPRFSEADGSTG